MFDRIANRKKAREELVSEWDERAGVQFDALAAAEDAAIEADERAGFNRVYTGPGRIGWNR